MRSTPVLTPSPHTPSHPNPHLHRGTFVLIINGVFLFYFMTVYVTNYSKKLHRNTLGIARFVEKRFSEFSDAWSTGSGSPSGSLSEGSAVIRTGKGKGNASRPKALRGVGKGRNNVRSTPLDKYKRRAAGGGFCSTLFCCVLTPHQVGHIFPLHS